jgi:polysaccharide export outer membrane protein
VKIAIPLFAALLCSACTISPGLNVVPDGNHADAGVMVVKGSGGEETLTFPAADGVITSIQVLPVNNSTLARIVQSAAASAATEDSQSIPNSAEAEYTLGVGDVLSVVVWDHPELTNPTGAGATGGDVNSGRVVDARGYIYYPYVGPVKVLGLTVNELRNKLTAGLARVIQTPQVDVKVSAYRSRRAQISGAVASPGSVALDDTQKGILEGLNERGGLGANGSRRSLLLTRAGKTYRLDAQQVAAGRGANANPRLLAGDVLFVPDRSEDQVFVMGAVKTEGAVFLDSTRTTLTQALAQSGGLDRTVSNDGGILVFRRPGQPGAAATVLKLDMGTPLGLLLAGEVELQPRDVVYVASTDFAKYNSIIGQLLPTIAAIFQVDALVNR